VVGAGCVGASVAYRLAQRGARVTVLDAGAPGAGTSGASFAWTNSFGKTPRGYHDLNVAGMEEHAALVKELKELPGGGWLHQDGALAWEDSPAGCARLDQAVERLAGWAVRSSASRPPRPRDRARSPHRPTSPVIWTPGEGLDAVPYVAALRGGPTPGLGCCPAAVAEVLRAADRVVGVRTETVSASRPGWWWTARASRPWSPARRPRGPARSRQGGSSTPHGRHHPAAAIHAPACASSRTAAGASCWPSTHGRVWREAVEAWPRSAAGRSGRPPARAGRRTVEATRVRLRHAARRASDGRQDRGSMATTWWSRSGALGPLWPHAAAELLDDVPDSRLAPYRPARFL
jgi:hypothetical protein